LKLLRAMVRAGVMEDGRIWGMRLVTCGSPDNFGLITLCGTVIAPRPFRPWRAPAERRR
jgi:hypothetical protein